MPLFGCRFRAFRTSVTLAIGLGLVPARRPVLFIPSVERQMQNHFRFKAGGLSGSRCQSASHTGTTIEC